MNAPPTYKHTHTESKKKKKNSNTKLQDELNFLNKPFGDYQKYNCMQFKN